MRISQSSLSLQGQSASYANHHVEERLQFSFRAAPIRPPAVETGKVIISDAARDSLAAAQESSEVAPEANTKDSTDPRLQILINLVEQLTGHKIQLFDASELTAAPGEARGNGSADRSANEAAAQPQPEWSLHFEHREVHEEAQATRFQASGVVKTADGREISFDLDLQMARFERSESLTTVDAGNVRKDPLILNMRGGPATLTAQRIAFDLDANPETADDMIAKPGHGSFFLALDRNANGRIDDGSELFGPATGDGFGELAQLDEDGNGWIDEADSTFAQLGVWTPGVALQSLGAAGVGAIALQNAATPFALREGTDDRGMIQSSGIFLTEDGLPGTIQHVDLTV